MFKYIDIASIEIATKIGYFLHLCDMDDELPSRMDRNGFDRKF